MDLKFIRRILIIYVSLTLSMSFLVIPFFGHNGDIFIFSDWKLFANPPQKSFYDITWDGGKSFLFRDHDRKEARIKEIDIHFLFHSVQKKKIKEDHLEILKQLGPCENLRLVKFKGPLYKHLLFNEKLERVKETGLCEH